MDRTEVEQLGFSRYGTVGVTFGQKNGPVAGPLYYWKIVSGRLRITGDDGGIYDELTLISRDSSKIVVRRRSGELATFKVLKP